VDPNWPQPLSGLPGNEQWNWDQQKVFSPRIQTASSSSSAANCQASKGRRKLISRNWGRVSAFPIGRLPWRDATTASPPGPLDGPNRGTENVDWRWQHCIVGVNAKGEIKETWPEWDSMLRRPHAIYINPYDKDNTCGW